MVNVAIGRVEDLKAIIARGMGSSRSGRMRHNYRDITILKVELAGHDEPTAPRRTEAIQLEQLYQVEALIPWHMFTWSDIDLLEASTHLSALFQPLNDDDDESSISFYGAVEFENFFAERHVDNEEGKDPLEQLAKTRAVIGPRYLKVSIVRNNATAPTPPTPPQDSSATGPSITADDELAASIAAEHTGAESANNTEETGGNESTNTSEGAVEPEASSVAEERVQPQVQGEGNAIPTPSLGRQVYPATQKIMTSC